MALYRTFVLCVLLVVRRLALFRVHGSASHSVCEGGRGLRERGRVARREWHDTVVARRLASPARRLGCRSSGVVATPVSVRIQAASRWQTCRQSPCTGSVCVCARAAYRRRADGKALSPCVLIAWRCLQLAATAAGAFYGHDSHKGSDVVPFGKSAPAPF